MSTNGPSVEQEQTMTFEECQATLTATQQENAELRDKYLRAVAALENARKHAERDANQRVNQRLRALFTNLLEVADHLERVLAHAGEDDILTPGVQAALHQLYSILRQEGVTLIAVEKGAAFDPLLHEAITTDVGDVDQPTVAQGLQSGYLLDGQVLRPARIAVTVPARSSR